MENNMTFEEIVAKLEECVKKLEDKNISLDDAVNEYQKGLELAKVAYKLFEDAKDKIVSSVENGEISEFKQED